MSIKRSSGLGRELRDLLEDNLPEERKKGADLVRVSAIEPRSDQPRKYFDRESLELLADSIATYGVLQPIIVRENELARGNYVIIAGERRWRAAKMAGLIEIPAVIFDGDELKAAQVSMIENIQRADLNPIEEAMGYRDLIERFGLTQEQVAKQLGKSRPVVTNALRLLDLPEDVLELLRDGRLSAGHARVLLSLADKELLPVYALKVAENGLSVRDTENLVRRANDRAAEAEEAAAEEEAALATPQGVMRKAEIRALEKRSTSALGRRVKISTSAKKRAVELYFSDDDDLAALLTAICGADFFEGN